MDILSFESFHETYLRPPLAKHGWPILIGICNHFGRNLFLSSAQRYCEYHHSLRLEYCGCFFGIFGREGQGECVDISFLVELKVAY